MAIMICSTNFRRCYRASGQKLKVVVGWRLKSYEGSKSWSQLVLYKQNRPYYDSREKFVITSGLKSSPAISPTSIKIWSTGGFRTTNVWHRMDSRVLYALQALVIMLSAL